MENETVSTGISLPADIMDLLDKQAKSRRMKRSPYIVQLVLDQEARNRAQFAPRNKTRQTVNA